jgi:hypothetical protein
MKLMKDIIPEPSVAFGPVGSEGGRSPSTLPTGNTVPNSGLAPGQRWSVGRKREVVLRLLRGEAAESLSRELGVPVYRLERWHERALPIGDEVRRNAPMARAGALGHTARGTPNAWLEKAQTAGQSRKAHPAAVATARKTARQHAKSVQHVAAAL